MIVFNNADRPLILLERQGLEGAKQNRVLQKTVIIPANRSLTVPVNCVEKERWNYNRNEFKPAKSAQKTGAETVSEMMDSLDISMSYSIPESSRRYIDYDDMLGKAKKGQIDRSNAVNFV